MNDDHVSITLNNTKITDNYAYLYGGGVSFGDGAYQGTLELKNNSEISNNTAGQYGGGISSTSQSGNYSTNYLTVKSPDYTGKISNNKAGSHGGGIYATGYDDTFTGLTITNNTSSGNGGGIYTNYNSSSNYSGVSNCTITGNIANYGGGIWAHRVAISKSTIQNNTARNAGGGVYANEYKFSGVITIDNNKLSNGSSSDAHIASKYKGSSTSNVGIKGIATNGSHIGIIRDNNYSPSMSDKDKTISTDASYHYRADSFFSNEGDPVVISLKETLGSNYNYSYYLYLTYGDGKSTDIKEVDSQLDLIDTGYKYKNKVVYKGYYTHSPVDSTSDSDVDSVYYYSDGYFLDDANNYNTHLATMSLAMTMAGFTSLYEGQKDTTTDTNSAEYVDEWSFSAKNIVKLYEDLGFDNVYLCDSYDEKPHLTTLGYSFAQKKIDDGYTLVPIVIRGNGYGSEWYSNVYIGESGEHKGFSDSAKLALTDLQQYIKDYGLEEELANGKVKFWVMGYSRAAACANVLSKYLVDTYKRGVTTTKDSNGNNIKAYSGNQIYAYTFATPKGGMNSSDYNDNIFNYLCIHNIINNADIVPDVAMEEMDFIRYGVDHYVPGTDASGAKAENTKTWSYVSEAQDGTSNTVWSTLYKTYSDNTYINTKTDAYVSARNKMVSQLSVAQPYLDFTDNFTTATINIYSSWIYGFLQSYSSNLKVEDYEKIFMRAFRAWGFYDNGTDGDVKLYKTEYLGNGLSNNIWDLENSTKNNLRYNAYKTSAKASIGVDMTLQESF